MRFEELFVGGTRAHGRWEQLPGEKTGEGSSRTVHEPVTPDLYQKHLAGLVSLGLVPIREDGTCRFGAIDIDDDTTDHKKLFDAVRQRRLPLSVCRSKSGGAHLYLFVREPGLPAAEIRGILVRWAGLLGYPKTEVFPKQGDLKPGAIGSWINLPYFGGDVSTRYAMREAALSLVDFLNQVEFYDPKRLPYEKAELPNDLKRSVEEVGGRNNYLFNFAVWLKSKYPEDWQARVRELNAMFSEPLSENEIISTCARGDLGYTRDADRGDQPGAFEHGQFSHLRKICTDPPSYQLDVDGHEMQLTAEELFSFSKLRFKAFQVYNKVIATMKQKNWEALMNTLLLQLEEISMPTETTTGGEIQGYVQEYLAKHQASHNLEDVLRDLPYKNERFLIFRMSGLQRFMKMKKEISNQKLGTILRQMGAHPDQKRIKGQVTNLWFLPMDQANLQTEEFTTREPGEDDVDL